LRAIVNQELSFSEHISSIVYKTHQLTTDNWVY